MRESYQELRAELPKVVRGEPAEEQEQVEELCVSKDDLEDQVQEILQPS